jgi:excisionase family DNA binding protein
MGTHRVKSHFSCAKSLIVLFSRIMTDDKPALTPAAAADRIGISTSLLNLWAREGKIPFSTTPGGHRRYAQADVDELARARHAESGGNVIATELRRIMRHYRQWHCFTAPDGLCWAVHTDPDDPAVVHAKTPAQLREEIIYYYRENL